MPRVNAEIGHIRIDKLRPQHLIRFYNKLAEPITEKRYQCIVDFKALLKKNTEKLSCLYILCPLLGGKMAGDTLKSG